jgi:transmembrane sensor
MTDTEPRLHDALTHIADAWSAERTERTLAGTRARRRRQQLTQRASAGAAVALVAVVAGFMVWRPEPTVPLAALPVTPPSAAAGPMQFEDGSRIELLDAAASVVVDEVTRERIAVRLLRGSVRVDVVPRPERAFRVECGAVSVSVLGTAFELTREAERTHVKVLRGRVAVDDAQGSLQLGAGDAGWFPRPVAAQPVSQPPPRRAAKVHNQDAGWQEQAKRGDYKRAYELMPASPESLPDDVEALLLAADAARLSGHPAQAVPFLRRVVEQHARDSRASLAAFTLGGVLLNQLDRPREADAAYGHARSLSLSATLAQDALARQVEAAQRAGDATRVRELAREYLRRYPQGRRVQWVRDTSGL